MSFLRLLIKTIIFTTAILIYFVISSLILTLAGFNFKRARPLLVKIVSIYSTIGLILFGVKLRKNILPFNANDNFLIVSNHLSYLDIMIISSHFPTCFVTSTEMKETPFLGQLCLLGGCLFVERRRRSGIAGEVAQITDALKNGLNVVVFPEAKSSNGEDVLKFRTPLFQAAINSGLNVLPLCINYRTLDGKKITLKNRDKVFWYGDMSFFGHALTLFSHKCVVADFSVMETIVTKSFSDKNAMADKSYQVVSNEFEIITHTS